MCTLKLLHLTSLIKTGLHQLVVELQSSPMRAYIDMQPTVFTHGAGATVICRRLYRISQLILSKLYSASSPMNVRPEVNPTVSSSWATY